MAQVQRGGICSGADNALGVMEERRSPHSPYARHQTLGLAALLKLWYHFHRESDCKNSQKQQTMVQGV